MKIPLRFQMTESDSGITTLLNAISFLYDREVVDISLIKSIYEQNLLTGFTTNYASRL